MAVLYDGVLFRLYN